MANEQNLTKMGKARGLTSEEAQKIGSKGGKASVEARRQRKTFKELFEMLLSLEVSDEQTKAFIKSLGITDENITNDMAITLSMYQEALKGNTKAFELIRDTTGEKPADKLQIEEPPVIKLERPDKKK